MPRAFSLRPGLFHHSVHRSLCHRLSVFSPPTRLLRPLQATRRQISCAGDVTRVQNASQHPVRDIFPDSIPLPPLEKPTSSTPLEYPLLSPPVITSPPAYAAGRPRLIDPVPSIYFRDTHPIYTKVKEAILMHSRAGDDRSLLEDERRPICQVAYDTVHDLKSLFHTLGHTQSVDEAWAAYAALVDYSSQYPQSFTYLPYIHLHRLARLICRTRPKTHRLYIRLLSLMSYILDVGGKLNTDELHSLIDLSAKGWRKTTVDDFKHGLRVLQYLSEGRLPTLDGSRPDTRPRFTFTPDISTYNTVLSAAARTNSIQQLRLVSGLIAHAGLSPDRVTHLVVLRFYAFNKGLSGVKSTLQKMRSLKLELGLDGLNSCIWAYGINGRVDIAMMIYRLLRHNIEPETGPGLSEIQDCINRLAEMYIFVEPNIQPNEITFHQVIQIMSYQGHFNEVVALFRDMVTFENVERGAALHAVDEGVLGPVPYEPTCVIYRAIFMGFAKHGVVDQGDNAGAESEWTLRNLDTFFDGFLRLPPETTISVSLMENLMRAYSVTSGHDLQLMRDIWTATENAFRTKPPKLAPNSRLQRLKRSLFPEAEQP